MTTTFRQHEKLMTRMAQRLGVDLDEAELRGALTPERRHDMVLSCTGCSNPGACGRKLATEGSDAPGYCRNAQELGAL